MDKFNVKNHISGLFLLATLFFIFTSIISCTKQKNNAISNPELEIANEINKRKIVILGEQPHRHPSGYNEVCLILNEWLGECKKTGYKNAKLNLVIEYHDSWTKLLNEYFETGNLTPFLDSNISLVGFEEIEFYSKLKRFSDSVKSLNKNEGYNIKFKISGFEEDATNFSPELSKKTIYEMQYWFVKERDSMIVQKFLKYYNENKEDKYLFYYGLGHLQKGLVSKRLDGFKVSQDSCYGYFLTGYLKKELGENNVITFAKYLTPPEKLTELKLDTLINKKYLIAGIDIRVEIFKKPQFDFIFFNPYTDFADHWFNLAYSKKVFEKALEKISELEKNSPDTWVYDFGRKILKKLSYLTGANFKDSKELKKWLGNQKSFELSHFDTKEYRDNLYGIYANDEDDEAAKLLLKQLGIEANLDTYRSIDSETWNNKIWPEALDNIKLINAIGILWAGYPDEKVKAKEFLVNFSKKDFAEPEKYLQWWRNVYHNYGIE